MKDLELELKQRQQEVVLYQEVWHSFMSMINLMSLQEMHRIKQELHRVLNAPLKPGSEGIDPKLLLEEQERSAAQATTLNERIRGLEERLAAAKQAASEAVAGVAVQHTANVKMRMHAQQARDEALEKLDGATQQIEQLQSRIKTQERLAKEREEEVNMY